MKQFFVSNDGTELIERESHPTFGESKRFVTYPCPTPFGKHLFGQEVLEGIDFRLQHQGRYESPSMLRWGNITEKLYQEWSGPKRIIAVPTAAIEKKEVYFPCTTNDASSVIFNSPSKEETQEDLWDEVLNIYDDTADYDGLNKPQAIQKFLSQFAITRK